MSVKKLKILIFVFIIANFLVACNNYKLNKPYDLATAKVFLYENSSIRNAKPFSENLLLPKNNYTQKADKVTVDTYLLASEKGNSSSIYKYREPYVKRSIASLTKIITFLVVINECDDLDRVVTVSANAVNLDSHSSKAGLKRGDHLTIKDLLYGLMLPSGNDCAIALAENVANSTSDFVVLMNRYAEKLGCVHSHFTNPHGLDDDYHYSTAFDMYLFLREASKNELFNKIISTKEWTLKIVTEEGFDKDLVVVQTNKYITGDVVAPEHVVVFGGKTGSTNKAGKCLALIANKKDTNEKFYMVVLYSSTDTTVYKNMQHLLNCLK